ncbi:hypothetical protein MKW94_027324 [Papaver nudicaule]|uniref:Protein kinase domain-containing protein n=1 Tax=Papaver nudicaule TaxID=74823 RepID=A0AA41UUV5_PAPNU|nr:hypothetical protein [Papaver nudicaule]
MARFPYFSCIRSSKGETGGPSEIKHASTDHGRLLSISRTETVKSDQPKYLRCVANAPESKELVVTTNTADPECVLGEGRLGRVYKGYLDSGQEVAVKWFDELADLSEEVQMLCSIDHPNIIKMIAYCDEGKDRVIVFEFMPLRSLNLHLRDLEPGKTPLDWNTRMKIAEGVAKALEYLHDQNDPPVIYSGLKSTSILLDENYNPKLSDFGCARHGPLWNYRSIHEKLVRGYGYIGLEYIITEVLTLKSDVFGFGVILLELISGEKAVKESIRGSGKHSLVSWAQPLLDNENFQDIVDPLMKGQYPYAGLVKALYLAKMCVKEEAHERPPIAEVVITLSKINSQIYEEPQVTTVADPSTLPNIMHHAQAVA